MVFSSLIFLFAYLTVTLALYYVVPNIKWRNAVLFVVSMLFYGWGEPLYIIVMLISILDAYIFGFFIEKYRDNRKKARMFMVISISINLVFLLFFKYCNFFIENLRLLPFLTDAIHPIEGLKLPIGISFYTFQIMSYTIDLYRGQTGVQKNFIAFGTYVTLFPQLIAGPIVRYRDVDDQLTERTESVDKFASGVHRFIVGLGKKVLIGDAAAAIYEYFKAAGEIEPTTMGAWMIMICYTLHIYYDFSGYSDMAIGLGKMVGFTFLENFNYPYIADSITDFWRRWHMSLGTWFKEYVYIPLGGNRVGRLKQYRNIAIVWFLTGFWHGASWNFILWGVYFGVILMLEKTFLLKLFDRLPRFVRHIYALLLIGIGWIIFSYTDAAAGLSCFAALFGIGTKAFANSVVWYQLLHSLPLLTIAGIGATPLPSRLWNKLAEKKPVVTGIGGIALAILSFVVVVSYLVDSTFSPFLYFIF